ncbi:MAG: hypothetical protein ACLQLG_10750 [Thermoguttaceae bacterium]
MRVPGATAGLSSSADLPRPNALLDKPGTMRSMVVPPRYRGDKNF